MSFGDVLIELTEHGSVLKSKWPKSESQTLDRLVGLGAVTLETKARGGRAVVTNHSVLMLEIRKRYPSWPDWKVDGHSRSESVLLTTDAHISNITYPWIGIRSLSNSNPVTVNGASLPLQADGWIFTSILEERISELRVQGKVILIENFESFIHADRLIDDLDVAVYYAGTMSNVFVDWVGNQDAEFVFSPDYDPVGMWQYQRLSEFDTVRLLVPKNLGFAFERFGNREVYSKGRSYLSLLSNLVDPRGDLLLVIELMREHRAGVMQELFHSKEWISEFRE